MASSRVAKALQAWRLDLENKDKAKAANLLADPNRGQDAELFEEGWLESLQKEEALYGTADAANNKMDVGSVFGSGRP